MLSKLLPPEAIGEALGRCKELYVGPCTSEREEIVEEALMVADAIMLRVGDGIDKASLTWGLAIVEFALRIKASQTIQ